MLAFTNRRKFTGCSSGSIQVILSAVEVVELGLGVDLLFENEHPLCFHDVSYFALRIEKVSEFPGTHRTDLDTGGVEPFPGSLNAESALLDYSYRPWPVTQIVCFRVEFFRWN